MQAYYERLMNLSTEAEDMRKLGASGRYLDEAMEKYKSFKAELPVLLKKSEKEWKGRAAPLHVIAYQNGLRNASFALKSPTHTSPSNPEWDGRVSEALSALEDELKKIADAMRKGVD